MSHKGRKAKAHQRGPADATSPSHSESSGPSEVAEELATGDATNLKIEHLDAFREEMKMLFKAELQEAFGMHLVSVKNELLVLKTELFASISTVTQEVSELKATVADMEHSLSTCTDDIVSLRTKVENMSKDLIRLDNKCEDLESRSRRNNVRRVGIPESQAISCEFVSTLLRDAFWLGKEPLVDRAHRAMNAIPSAGGRPRAVVTRLHYYSDCAEILRRARELQQIKTRDIAISVFPDFTAKTARARAAFNDVRRQLRDIGGIRFGILHPAKLRITHDGKQRDFISPEEAAKFVKTITG
ncbi:unnamed protein product [Knipowitschia caucasica]